jgi:ribonuclease G
MEVAAHRKAVSRTLERALEDDKAKTKILNISGIGLVEMTRQRMRRSVEGKYYQRCPYCGGRGMVKSVSTVSMELMRRLEDALAKAPRARETFVTLHPDVAAFMNAPERNMIKSLERRFRKKIRVIEDPQIHIENIKIDQG